MGGRSTDRRLIRGMVRSHLPRAMMSARRTVSTSPVGPQLEAMSLRNDRLIPTGIKGLGERYCRDSFGGNGQAFESAIPAGGDVALGYSPAWARTGCFFGKPLLMVIGPHIFDSSIFHRVGLTGTEEYSSSSSSSSMSGAARTSMMAAAGGASARDKIGGLTDGGK